MVLASYLDPCPGRPPRPGLGHRVGHVVKMKYQRPDNDNAVYTVPIEHVSIFHAPRRALSGAYGVHVLVLKYCRKPLSLLTSMCPCGPTPTLLFVRLPLFPLSTSSRLLSDWPPFLLGAAPGVC